jgi:hypothetical protein
LKLNYTKHEIQGLKCHFTLSILETGAIRIPNSSLKRGQKRGEEGNREEIEPMNTAGKEGKQMSISPVRGLNQGHGISYDITCNVINVDM